MPRLRLPGPTAPWLDEEDDGPDIYSQVRLDVVQTLTAPLLLRIQRLEQAQLDDVLAEIRLQMMECAAAGNLGRASDLADLAVSFVTTTEYQQPPQKTDEDDGL